MAKTQIRVVTKVTGYAKKKGKGCYHLKYGDVKLTEAQIKKLDFLIDNDVEIKLVMEPVQENLPGMDE